MKVYVNQTVVQSPDLLIRGSKANLTLSFSNRLRLCELHYYLTCGALCPMFYFTHPCFLRRLPLLVRLYVFSFISLVLRDNAVRISQLETQKPKFTCVRADTDKMSTTLPLNLDMDSSTKLRIPSDTLLVKKRMRADEVALSDFDKDAVDLARLGKKQVLEVYFPSFHMSLIAH